MNKKLLCAALLSGLALAQTAVAQDYDDRWYIAPSAGFNLQDGDRGTRNAGFVAFGVGKQISPNWSLEGQLNYQNPRFDDQDTIVNPSFGLRAQDLNWSQYGISIDARRFFTAEGRNWNPYALVGLGYQKSEEEFDAYPSVNSPGQREDGNLAAKLGLGLQGDLGRVKARAELAYRADLDDGSVAAVRNDDPFPERNDGEDWFGDVLASVGLVIPLGPEASEPAPVAPQPQAPNCADMDDDGDGVNNCNDKCANSQAGQTIGADGCPVTVSFDLKGVNFNFDKDTLRPDAIAILNEAVSVLTRYPQIRVEVAGHTDLCGNEGYNQNLSQRRAQVVYNYLTSNGIDAGRLAGPNGYGESRPLEQTDQATPGCRSETNRRTELNVQN